MQIPGVYKFKHKNTEQKYVGSSSQLAIRFFGYFKFQYQTTGKLIPFIHKEKLSNFSLEIIPLYDNYDFRSEIVLEQYYLLDPSFNLNTIKVANNPSGSNAKSSLITVLCLVLYFFLVLVLFITFSIFYPSLLTFSLTFSLKIICRRYSGS